MDVQNGGVGSCAIDPSDLRLVLSAAAPVFERLRGRRIFLTGGTGFIGGWLVETFAYACRQLDLDAHMTLLVRPGDDPCHLGKLAGVSVVAGDITSLCWTELSAALKSQGFPSNFDAVIHCAVNVTQLQGTARYLGIWDSVVAGSKNVLDISLRCGADRVLLLSSGAVYGRQSIEIERLSEDYLGGPDPLDPTTTYAEGKRTMENLAAGYLHDHGLQSTIARCFSFVGPRISLQGHLAAGQFIRAIRAGRPIRVLGDGSPVRTYLYTVDLAIWLWTILMNGQVGTAYNVGSEEPRTIAQLAEAFGQIAGVPVEVLGKAVIGGVGDRYVPNTHKARHELGLAELTDFDSAVRKTLAWFKDTNGCNVANL